MSLLLSCSNVSKNYINHTDAKLTQALNDVSFDLEEGDRLGLIGLNGSGKSTLLKILSGIIRPSSGKVQIYKRVHSLSSFDSALHQDLTGRENIVFQLRMLNNGLGWRNKLLDEIIEFSELGRFIDHPVKNYSSGMMLRLSFSIFKAIQPEILLLDEVFSAGDMTFQKKAETLLKEQLNKSAGLIMASHQLNEITAFCNKCIIIEKGNIVFLGTVDDAVNFYIDTNRVKHLNIFENEVVAVNEIMLNNNKSSFKYSEDVEIAFEYTQKKTGRLDVVIYITNNFGNIMTDCPLYRQEHSPANGRLGKYLVSIVIPKFILNKGKYYIDFVFGDGENDILLLRDILSFSVTPDDWELNKLWNINPKFPVRPQLSWHTKYVER